MRILDTVLDGVKLIQPVVYEDFRGTNFESYNEVMYRDELPFSPFVVDSISTSRKHTLRGIHGDSKTTKLVTNGHLVMSDEAVFSYKLSEYYDRESQFTIKWNDPMHNFFWPVKHPILSERDS